MVAPDAFPELAFGAGVAVLGEHEEPLDADGLDVPLLLLAEAQVFLRLVERAAVAGQACGQEMHARAARPVAQAQRQPLLGLGEVATLEGLLGRLHLPLHPEMKRRRAEPD